MNVFQDEDNVNAEKEKYEDWIKSIDQPYCPYIIACGNLDNFSSVSVVINTKNYASESLVKAVETCYKCLVSLQVSPYTCDYVWTYGNSLREQCTKKARKNLTRWY